MVDGQNDAGVDAAIRQQIGQGLGLLQQGRIEEALQASFDLVTQYPRHPQVLYFASEARLAGGSPPLALNAINAAIAVAPGQRALLLKKAHILVLMRRRREAREAAIDAADFANGNGRSLWAIGKIHGNSGDPAKASELFGQALATGFSHPGLHYDQAAVLIRLGQADAAEEQIEALLALAPQTGYALWLRSSLRRQTTDRNHVADLQARLTTGFAEAASRAACLFALARELEDLGEHERAITVLNEAAAIKRPTMTFEPQTERDAIDGIRVAWTTEAMAQAGPGHDEAGAIFLVGMPMAGTSQVERLLGRHGEVGLAGELLDFGQLLAAAAQKAQAENPGLSLAEASLKIDFAALGRDYMAGAREAADGQRYFVDTMPVNYMYCGLIRKALPNAHIVHVLRDPMDTCHALYKTLFNQAYPFSYDQDELAAYYATYHQLMQHWHAVLPGEIFDLRHAELVADPETQARRLLEFCDLPWQPEVLTRDANEAATTPQDWRQAESGLAPLKAALTARGII